MGFGPRHCGCGGVISVTRDSTSHIFFPANATEAAAWLNGLGIGAPIALYQLQEAAGPFIDSISGINLTNGAMTTNAPVTGWSRLAIKATPDGSGNFAENIGSWPDLHNTSQTLLLLIAVTNTPSGGRTILGLGGASAGDIFVNYNASNQYVITDGTNTATGTVNHGTGVVPLLVRHNQTIGLTDDLFVGSFTAAEKISKTFHAPVAGATTFGFGAFSLTTPVMELLGAIAWDGSAAEMTDAQVVALLNRFVTGFVASITITPASPSIVAGGTQQMVAAATMGDGSTYDASSDLHTTWASSNSSVATVSSTGLVTAMSVGTTAITATYGGVTSGVDTVTVTASVIVDEVEHHPWPNRGGGLFEFEDQKVVWTGDRLLIARPNDFSLGSSAFWQRGKGDGTGTDVLPWGIPAYLPLETDFIPALKAVGGGFQGYVATCLTESLRVIASTTSTGAIALDVFDRASNGLINHTEFVVPSGPQSYRAIKSGSSIVVTMMRGPGIDGVYMTAWTGESWTLPELLVSGQVISYEIAQVSDGFYIVWTTGTSSITGANVGKVVGTSAASSPIAWPTNIPQVPVLDGVHTPTGGVAISVAPDSSFAIVLGTTTGPMYKAYNANGSNAAVSSYFDIGSSGQAAAYDPFSGLSVCSRGLRNANGVYEYVIHWGGGGGVNVASFDPSTGSITNAFLNTKFNSRLASKSFLVGDEVFVWCTANNAKTNFLLAGEYQPLICGYADRESASASAPEDGNTCFLFQVTPDPLSHTKASWARTFNTGQIYSRPGNVAAGDLDFLPQLSCITYGKGAYMSGSSVRVWDGTELGDAGWQDYPRVFSATPQTIAGGNLVVSSSLGYEYLCRVVRYSKQGERFESAAVTAGPFFVTASHNSLQLQIATVPSNHMDAVIEVYRTELGGTAFFLEGTVANDQTQQFVTFNSTLKDVSSPSVSTDLIEQPGDSHATGVGQVQELESWGPVGCAILTSANDRIWGAGGQVPAGTVQFSKLRDDGFGAGFDDLAGFQEVDTQGGQITSVWAYNDAIVVSEKTTIYVLQGSGPDNDGNGSFGAPSLVLADGAITHQGTALTHVGVSFWGDGGPRLFTPDLQVHNISIPVLKLSSRMIPTGVRVDLDRQEVVWYTAEGDALLWSYYGGNSRFARWNRLPVAGVSQTALVTTDGRLLTPDSDIVGDDGAPVAMVIRTGPVKASDVVAGGTYVRSVGVAGSFLGDHELRTRVYYDGSPLWADQWTWDPTDGTWLSDGNSFGALTPAQVDAAGEVDKTGAYFTHKRTYRDQCAYLQVEISDKGATNKTLVPMEVTLEIGQKPGLARVPPSTFGS